MLYMMQNHAIESDDIEMMALAPSLAEEDASAPRSGLPGVRRDASASFISSGATAQR
ncbi:hypothetical protein [Sorangium sp. So ce406]|uniref:hypothetical protein n=1 Tax=Sorangium sp. So ce406 TaxID=3133311 RepID=UPI003F5CA0FB